MATFVILHPHSSTNPSDKYRVVDFYDWRSVDNILLCDYTSHDTYEAAKQDADARNTVV